MLWREKQTDNIYQFPIVFEEARGSKEVLWATADGLHAAGFSPSAMSAFSSLSLDTCIPLHSVLLTKIHMFLVNHRVGLLSIYLVLKPLLSIRVVVIPMPQLEMPWKYCWMSVMCFIIFLWALILSLKIQKWDNAMNVTTFLFLHFLLATQLK